MKKTSGSFGLVEFSASLGISKSTVSRALNGHPAVNVKTRKKILEAAEATGFRLNKTARRLRTNKADAIGFILSSPQIDFANELSLRVIAGLDDAIRPAGKLLYVASAHDHEDEMTILRTMVEGGSVDAVAFGRVRRDDERIEFLSSINFPFASIGSVEKSPSYPTIDLDQVELGRLMAETLIKNGHRKLHLLPGPKPLLLTEHVAQGFVAGLEGTGAMMSVTETDLTEEAAYSAVKALLEQGDVPDAIACALDPMAFGVYRALNEAKLVPGKDVSVIGANEISGAAYASPPLTSFRFDARAAGRRLGELILQHLDDPAPTYPLSRFKPVIQLRDSVKPR